MYFTLIINHWIYVQFSVHFLSGTYPQTSKLFCGWEFQKCQDRSRVMYASSKKSRVLNRKTTTAHTHTSKSEHFDFSVHPLILIINYNTLICTAIVWHWFRTELLLIENKCKNCIIVKYKKYKNMKFRSYYYFKSCNVSNTMK